MLFGIDGIIIIDMGLFSKGKTPEEKKALAETRVSETIIRDSEKALKFVSSDGTDVSGAIFALKSLENLTKMISPHLVLFPDRVLKVSGNLLLRGKEFTPIEKITSVEISGGIMPTIEIHTSGNTIVFKSDVISGPHFVELLRGLIDSKGSKSASSKESTSSVDALEKLANLLERGLITEAEFKSEKAKIISS